ncbi:transport and Golgi organization 2 homolog [Anneissia japonica]|uniref:transport and Golgi organization 2 homolog n=1 Tax=Anneissia japonica TaxID=1529436 RepID=UPI0014254F7A|nr:transport and Golgi organization 2 homolog [Anneissia japonica]
MCVTWFMVNEDPEISGYKLVLAFNREEYFNRPTSHANFLGSNKDTLYGVDMKPGKEGGTWLGISTKGRVAFVLNIRGTGNPDLKGRGLL